MLECIRKFTEPCGLIGLREYPENGSTENGLLFTAEWYLVDPSVTTQDVDRFCDLIEDSITKSYVRRGPHNIFPISYDDFIGIFAFYFAYGLRTQARSLYNMMNAVNWVNMDNALGRFQHMIQFAKFCATGKLSFFGILAISAAFVHNMFVEKEETSGRCLLIMMADCLSGSSLILDVVLNVWRFKMRSLYPTGRKEVYEIYFTRNDCFEKNCKKDF